VVNVGVPTGLAAYRPTVTDPAPPVPVIVMEPLVLVELTTAGADPVLVPVLQLDRLVQVLPVLPVVNVKLSAGEFAAE
jgi:hypothetical protein